MTKQEIIKILKDKKIISNNNKKKFCWKSYWDDEIDKIFNEFKQNYRSDDEAWFCLLNNIEPYHCEICGELAKFTGTKKTKYIGYNCVCETCNSNLAPSKLNVYHKTISERTIEDKQNILEKRKKTNLEKYGDENYTLFGSNKFKETLKEKYGDEHYNNREKYKETCLERYGVTCNLSLNSSERSSRIWNEQYDEIIDKIKRTNLSKYGVEFAGQSLNIINKIVTSKQIHVQDIEKCYNCTQQKKLFKKYGQGWKSLHLEKLLINGRKFISNEYIPLIEEYVSEGNTTNLNISKEEKEFLRFLKTVYSGKIIENSKNIICGNKCFYELDMFLPNINIAFEFNGTYWHSTLYKDKYYHQRKTLLCYAQGIQLVHIWENDWINNRNVIEQRIYELLNGKDCSQYNWVSIKDIENYILTEPEEIHINNLTIFNEGKFIKK